MRERRRGEARGVHAEHSRRCPYDWLECSTKHSHELLVNRNRNLSEMNESGLEIPLALLGVSPLGW